MSKETKANKKGKAPTTSGRRGGGGKKGNTGSGESVGDPLSDPDPTANPDSAPVMQKGLHGVPGSKDDSRRCTAKKVNSGGERCKAPAIKGGVVCRVHGGASKQVKKAAKERLLELVDPALAALHKVLTDPHADDSVKVRASLGILDRTGFGPGQTVTLQSSPFDAMVADALEISEGTTPVDRSALAPVSRPALNPAADADDLWEDGHQHGVDAQTEAWREHDAEDEQPYATRLDRFGIDVVQGEVILREDLGPFPPTPPGKPSEFTG